MTKQKKITIISLIVIAMMSFCLFFCLQNNKTEVYADERIHGGEEGYEYKTDSYGVNNFWYGPRYSSSDNKVYFDLYGQATRKLKTEKFEASYDDQVHFIVIYGQAEMINELYSIEAANNSGYSFGTYDQYFVCKGNNTRQSIRADSFTEKQKNLDIIKKYDTTGTLDYYEFNRSSDFTYCGEYKSGYRCSLDASALRKDINYGFYVIAYIANIFKYSRYAMSSVMTFNPRNELQSYIKSGHYFSAYYEQALGIYLEGNTKVNIHYKECTGFNSSIEKTRTIEIESRYVPCIDKVKAAVISGFSDGISAYNVNYTQQALVDSLGDWVNVETFGSKTIREATGIKSSYDTSGDLAEIPASIDVDIVYSDYNASNFCMQISNSNAKVDNKLKIYYYPTLSNSNKTLTFDYGTICKLFNNTFNWTAKENIFTVNIPSMPSGVTATEELTGETISFTDQDGNSGTYECKKLVMTTTDASLLDGIEITANAAITEPQELTASVEYVALDNELNQETKTMDIGKVYDNNIGTMATTLVSKDSDSEYTKTIFNAVKTEGFTYMTPNSCINSSDYNNKTVVFKVNYLYDTVYKFVDKSNNILGIRNAEGSTTIKSLNLTIPEGYRIASISNDFYSGFSYVVDEPELNDITLKYSGFNDNDAPIVIVCDLKDTWPVFIKYLTPYVYNNGTNSPFCEMKTLSKEVKYADYPDLFSLTPTDIEAIVGESNVASFNIGSIGIEILKENGISVNRDGDTYYITLSYSNWAIKQMQSDGEYTFVNVELTPFSMWKDQFDTAWNITWLADGFQYSDDVLPENLYGLFTVAVFKEQLSDPNYWFSKYASDGCVCNFSTKKVVGSDFYKWTQNNGGIIIKYIVGSGAELINDDNGYLYSYFLYLDGTTTKVYTARNNADNYDDTSSSVVNFGEDVVGSIKNTFSSLWSSFTGSTFVKVLKIILILSLGVIVFSLVFKVVRLIFSTNNNDKKK